MANFVLFTDEHKSPEVHHEAAVILKIEKASELQRRLQKFARDLFPEQVKNNWVDIHASPMWHRVHEKKNRKTNWKTVSEETVVEFFQNACSTINELSEEIYIQRLRMRGTQNTYFKDPERYYAIRFLLHRVDRLAATSGGSAQAFCDEESDHGIEKEIQTGLHEYIALGKRSPRNPPISSTILPIHFVSSTDSVGVQAADIVAFIYGRYLANKKNPKKDYVQVQTLVELLTKLETSTPWPYR